MLPARLFPDLLIVRIGLTLRALAAGRIMPAQSEIVQEQFTFAERDWIPPRESGMCRERLGGNAVPQASGFGVHAGKPRPQLSETLPGSPLAADWQNS